MRASALCAVSLLVLALAVAPLDGRAQSERDFVFTDLEGHLIIRFAGFGSARLDPSQVYEISNSEFSSMVHDRLHADLQFENEPADTDWAASIEPQIGQHVRHAGPEFSDVSVECRAASCRVIMEQPVHWNLPAHRAVLETVQKSLEAFIAARRQDFEPGFMITAYFQESETSHIKAFLRRSGRTPPNLPAGG